MQLAPGHPRRLVTAARVRTDFRLLECTEELLEAIQNEGVVIKGGEDDEAVLCTGSTTFAVKYVETTNLQLLIAPTTDDAGCQLDEADDHMDLENAPPILSAPGLQTQLVKLADGSSRTPAVTVAAINQSHLELVETAPRLSVLESLLSERLYGVEDESQGTTTGPEQQEPSAASASGSGSGLYTLEDLQERVQASRAEILSGLQLLGAVRLGRHWRLIGPSYLGTTLELIISSAQQEGYPLSAIPAHEICASLKEAGYDEAVVLHCLASHATPCSMDLEQQQQQQQQPGMHQADGACFAMDEAKVCKHFASKLLAGGRQLPVADFMASWQAAVPDGMQPCLEMLRGEALVLGKGNAAAIKHFSARELPKDPARRFAALFSERARWEASDLEPYIADLKVPGLSSGALLLKYTRAVQGCPSDPLTYSAR